MPRISRTLTAVAALAVASVLTGPALAQPVSSSAGGVQTSDQQSPADKQIAARVYDQLNADQVDYYKHVTVAAEKGVVTLGGSVATTSALNKAKKIAQSVQGVTKVVDKMTVERSPTHPSGD